MNKEALKQILDAMKLHTAETHPLVETERAIELIEAELAKPEQEPVAWRWRWREGTMGVLGETLQTKWNFAQEKVKVHPDYVKAVEIEALYTAPPQRQPLTAAQIDKIILDSEITLVNYCCDDKQTAFARAVEAAHGIKEQP